MKLKNIILGAILAVGSILNAQQPQTQNAPLYAVNAKYTNGVAPGYYPTQQAIGTLPAATGLTINVGQGTVYCTLGSIVNYAGGTLTLTDNSTNYIYLDGASSCAPTSNTTGFSTNQVPVATVVTASGAISSVVDDRTMFSNVVTTAPGSGCPTTGCTFTGPVILAGDPTTALQAATKQYADNHPFLDPLGFGCVPNSTVGADETANVACLSSVLNTFGRIQLGAGAWHINSCVNVTNFGGITFEGSSTGGTSIIQDTDGTCGIEFTGFDANEIVVRNFAFSHKNVQTPPVNQSSNSSAPFLFINGSSTNAFFRFEFDRLTFANSSRGIELSKSAGQVIWAYNLLNLTATSTLQGALVNFVQGGSGGNPRPYMHQLFCTQVSINEPCIVITNGFEIHLDGIEVTPTGTPAASFLPVIDVTGSEDGTVENVHIENLHVGVAGNRLIAEENSNIINKNISASVNVCPSGDACHGTSFPDLSFVSNVAGGGTISAKNVTMFLYGTSNTSTDLFGIKYANNGNEAECDNFATVGLGTGVASCVNPSSDFGRLTRNGPQYAVIASAPASAAWNITSVATTSGGAAVYTGTFTGCTTGALQYTLITGFVTNPVNNGFFRFRSCTPTTLTVINGSSVAETHAATATVGVDGVGLPFYSRWWNGSSSQLTTCVPNVRPTYNNVSGLWDNYYSTFCTGTQANSQSYSNPMGWFQMFTAPGSNNQDIVTSKLGLSGVWTMGALVPGDTFGGLPVLRGSKNVGGVVVDTDFRAGADLSGTALGEICPSPSNAGAFGTLTPQTDQQCSFMTNRAGDWFNENGLASPIIPHTVTGFEGGSTGIKVLGCTGTTTNGNLLKFDVNGACTDSGIASATLSSIANITISTGTSSVAANECLPVKASAATATAMTGLATTSAIIPPTPASDTASIAGWGASGGLEFTYYPTANTLNWRVCNVTSSPITPGGTVTWNVGAR